ncbi:MAG: MFS transporter [Candidatus Lokiarchaeota archaeon]|nr:MFS transporter [Candidatus Lokiarchaeota archaeon]
MTKMEEKDIQIYGYRWIVLLLFMFTNITIQMLWISYASVTSAAMAFYNVEELSIFLLSALFMIVYIPVTFIASWTIDKYDFKIGCGIGALLAGIFGFLRFFAGNNFTLTLIFVIGIAIGQPFIMNSVTKLSANWFPESERTTATGLGMISMFLGIALGLLITPLIVVDLGFLMMLLIYGILALCSGVAFLVFVKNKPPTPPSTTTVSEKVLMFEGIKKLFKNKYFLILLITFFFGLGIFNMITTYIEVIVIPRGFDSTYAGILGALMLVGGIVGCVVMSGLSDKFHIRRILLIISVLIATVSLFIITIATDGILLAISGFFFGFGLLSASPVALEYAADITKPVPEASSNGLLMMIGQIGGIFFILGLSDLKMEITGDYFPALLLQAIFLLILSVLTFFLKEEKSGNR